MRRRAGASFFAVLHETDRTGRLLGGAAFRRRVRFQAARAFSGDISGRHSHQQVEGLTGCAKVSAILPCNIERRAMGRRCHWNRQTPGKGHAAFEAQQLNRNLTLVVIHRHDGVDFAALGL